MKRKTIHLTGEKRHELERLLNGYGMDIDIVVEGEALKSGGALGAGKRHELKPGDIVLGVDQYEVVR